MSSGGRSAVGLRAVGCREDGAGHRQSRGHAGSAKHRAQAGFYATNGSDESAGQRRTVGHQLRVVDSARHRDNCLMGALQGQRHSDGGGAKFLTQALEPQRTAAGLSPDPIVDPMRRARCPVGVRDSASR